MAFGIERWLYAIASRHGCDPAAWPDPVAAVRRAAAALAAADARMLTEVGQA